MHRDRKAAASRNRLTLGLPHLKNDDRMDATLVLPAELLHLLAGEDLSGEALETDGGLLLLTSAALLVVLLELTEHALREAPAPMRLQEDDGLKALLELLLTQVLKAAHREEPPDRCLKSDLIGREQFAPE